MPESVDTRRLKLTNDEGTKGVLLGLRCLECGTVIFGPGTFCQRCTSAKLEPMEFSQTGTLYSYTVVRIPPAGWPGPVPYILAQVELSEGPQVLAELVDCLLFDGLRVHVIPSFSTVRSDIVPLPRTSCHSGFGLGRPPFVHYFGGAGVFPLYKSESKFHRHAYL